MQTIEVTNINRVQKLQIPVPEDGGVVVLRGRNGSGKSTTLEAVKTLVTGDGSPQVTDGQLRGELSGFGAKLTVGKAKRRSGELEVHMLEGRFDVADLVDPGIDSPVPADAARIKALVNLAGAEGDVSLFHGLVGGAQSFNRVISEPITGKDILAIAAAVKRGFERSARAMQSSAEAAAGRAKGFRQSADGVDLTGESDAEVLQSALEEAIQVQSRLNEQAEAAGNSVRAVAEAAERLAAAEAQFPAGAIDAKQQAAAEAEADLAACRQAVADADAALTAALAAADKAERHAENARAAQRHAEEMARLIEGWRKTIRDATACAPSQDQMDQAAATVVAAREALSHGVLARKAREDIRCAAEAEEEAQSCQDSADMLRNAARAVDTVISEQVAKLGTKLRVDEGRLVLDTERGVTYFSDLSEGERWKIAVEIAANATGENGLLVIPQQAWEGLDPTNQQSIARHAKSLKLLILTAEASDDAEIIAEEVAA